MLRSVDDAARYLGLQPSTLRRWVYERRVGVVKIGRRVLFKLETLDELIRRGERPALRSHRGVDAERGQP